MNPILNTVVIGNSRDKGDFIYISTEYKKSKMVSTTLVENHRKQLKEKPLPGVQYNKYFMGVNGYDYFITQCCQTLEHKRTWNSCNST